MEIIPILIVASPFVVIGLLALGYRVGHADGKMYEKFESATDLNKQFMTIKTIEQLYEELDRE